MKTKVLFVTKQMIMGGVEKSLIALLGKMPKDKFDVTVLVMSLNGELIKHIPREVKVKSLFGSEKTTFEKLRKYILKGNFIMALKVLFYTILIKRGVKTSFDENMYYSKMLPIENTAYDLAIAYHIPTSLPVIYVMENIKANQKVAWIHSDVSKFKDRLLHYKRFYEKYDYIFGVSHYTVGKFGEVFPHLKNKTAIFYNIIDKNSLGIMATKANSYADHFDGIRILTIGRLEEEKGQDIIPHVLSRILEDGYSVRWYCIGDGGMRSKLKESIQQNRLEDHFILLGTLDNPYPFIRDCDLYIQPSRHEAYCLTVAEARIFHKPIITTNTGASEQIIHENTGLVVDFDENQMYEAIKRLLCDEILKNKLIKNLSQKSFDTTNEIEKLYQLTQFN